MAPNHRPTILETIVANRRHHLPAIKAQLRHVAIADLPRSTCSLFDALKQGRSGDAQQQRGGRHFIMECKAASPSLGTIRHAYDPAAMARIYSRYASAISVLCEPDSFGGSYHHLSAVRAATHLPVLCKDFMIDPCQVIAARYYGADAILLMLSVLDDASYRQLANLAIRLGLDIVTEVVNEEEIDRAIHLGAQIFGINHRNLHDLSIDLQRSMHLEKRIPKHAVVVAESGIRDHQTMRQISPYADAFLVGSRLSGDSAIDIACRSLVYGNHKICGLRRIDEAQNARACGAVYGGLIFEASSPRHLSPENAKAIIAATPDLRFVAVSRRTSGWAALAQLGVFAIQIHAPLQPSIDKELAMIQSIAAELPPHIALWRAIDMNQPQATDFATALLENAAVSQLVLDAGSGGTGQCFDWHKISPALARQSFLAGGLNLDNIAAAMDTGIAGLDFNSGLEYSDGSAKDPTAVRHAFAYLRRA